jgi:hypothetical protein
VCCRSVAAKDIMGALIEEREMSRRRERAGRFVLPAHSRTQMTTEEFFSQKNAQ